MRKYFITIGVYFSIFITSAFFFQNCSPIKFSPGQTNSASSSPNTQSSSNTQNTLCIPHSTSPCSVDHGTGSSTCNDNGTAYGACVVVNCDSGFNLNAGSCVQTNSCENQNLSYQDSSFSKTFATPGVYQWQVPNDVTSVNVVCVGAGAPGGCWDLDGEDSSFGSFIVAHGGKSSNHGGVGGTFSFPGGAWAENSGGGNGGTAGQGYESGGGGAGGYTGNGGNGGVSSNGGSSNLLFINGGDGVGGGGGGGAGSTSNHGGGGGGVGLFGIGVNGRGATALKTLEENNSIGYGGQGGSGGASGLGDSHCRFGTGGGHGGGGGGDYGRTGGGGGALAWRNKIAVNPGSTIEVRVGSGKPSVDLTNPASLLPGGYQCGSYLAADGFGGHGACRILWKPGSAFPSTNVDTN
ncbi:MAG: hypothetical protein ACXVCY_05795 [Pseudobdellovibrionaceae bacterium]